MGRNREAALGRRHTDLQQAVAVDQQVAGFDVSVQDPGGVQVLQP